MPHNKQYGDKMKTLAKIEDFDDVDFNPFIISGQVARQDTVSNIYGELRRLRHEDPVREMDPRLYFGTAPDGTLEGIKKWTVLGHPLVTRLLTNTNEFSNKNYLQNLGKMFGKDSITTMDAPDHRSFRMLFQQAFAPNMLGEWQTSLVPRLINSLVEQFESDGQAELISQFSLHFPFLFVMELLNLPSEDRKIFHKLAFCQTAVRYDYAHATEAGAKLTRYITSLIEERRENPPSPTDFVHVLAHAKVEGEHLPHSIFVSFLRQLMNAAGDTSYHGFSNLLAALLNNPDQLEAIKADRSLVATAIDEALRWEAPIVFLERTPHQEIELNGHRILPGEHISVSIGDANRDESIYEDPDRFNIFRKKARHSSFGQGPHICIGQHLARVEMTVALNTLLDRLPNLRLDPDQPPPVVHGVSMRKPKAVHVLFG